MNMESEQWKGEDIDYHNRIAEIYDSSAMMRELAPYRKYVAQEWMRVLREHKAKSVLDFGCGTGILTVQIATAGFNVIGLDHSAGMLEVLSRRLEHLNLTSNCHLQVGDGEALPFEDESFDGVVCTGVLHHIPNIDKVLEELVRIIRKNGLLFIIEPNNEGDIFRRIGQIIKRTVGLLLRFWLKKGNLYQHKDTGRQISGVKTLKKLQQIGLQCNITYLAHPPMIYRFLPITMAYAMVASIGKLGGAIAISRDFFIIIGSKK